MTNETPAEPRLTIRLGKELSSDVVDFVVMVRDGKGGVTYRSSCDSWAIGAAEGMLTDIHVKREMRAHDEE